MFNGQPSGGPSFASFYGPGTPYPGPGQGGMAPANFASHPMSSGPPPQFYSYGDASRSYRRVQATGAPGPSGSMVSGMPSSANLGPGQSFSTAPDPLNALQNLAARQGAAAPPTGIPQQQQNRQPSYQMMTAQSQGPTQQAAPQHMYAQQPPISMSQMQQRAAPMNYEAPRGTPEQFARVGSFQGVSAAKPMVPMSSGGNVAQGGAPMYANNVAMMHHQQQQQMQQQQMHLQQQQQQQQQQQDEAMKEKLRQLSACYFEGLKAVMNSSPENRQRLASLFNILAHPTLETARSFNLKLDTLVNIEQMLLNLGLRPAMEQQVMPGPPNACVPPPMPVSSASASMPPVAAQVGVGGPVAPTMASAQRAPASPPAPGSTETEVKGPYSIGNELFCLLERLSGSDEGRRKLNLARAAIHSQLQLDAVAGQPSHVNRGKACKREAPTGGVIEEVEKRAKLTNLEEDEELGPDKNEEIPQQGEEEEEDEQEVLSDADDPNPEDGEDEERGEAVEAAPPRGRSLLHVAALQAMAPLRPSTEEVEEEEEEAPPVQTVFPQEVLAARLSANVSAEIRSLPVAFRVCLNSEPPAMARMETEDSCIGPEEWNASLHLLVSYEDKELPAPLPPLPMRLPVDYPEFLHTSWLVDRDAYGLEESEKSGEESSRFLRLVGERFDRRSQELRKTYAEELSLYRVLVTWHLAILDAFGKYSGLEDLKQNPYF